MDKPVLGAATARELASELASVQAKVVQAVATADEKLRDYERLERLTRERRGITSDKQDDFSVRDTRQLA